MICATVITHLFLTAAALATPSLETRLLHHAAGHQSNILDAPADINVRDDTIPIKVWGGGVYSYPENSITSVSGVFTIPDNANSASIAVRIDGVTCTSAMFQAGIDVTFSDDKVLLNPWRQWYPLPVEKITDMDIEVGHQVRLTVATSSKLSGTITIDNMSTNKTNTYHSTTTAPLCGQDASWVVEDLMLTAPPGPFANFGTVVFTEAIATTPNGNIGPKDATPVVRQNGQTLNSTFIDSSSITIKFQMDLLG